ncbi:MAG: hydrogenase maturation protease [Betaproteobacteria bacterium]|nr:hydrogenase maturation protease [Betaproteobacteria bacterium]
MPAKIAPFLVIGIGNPSRGDDALGPLLVERIEAMELPGVECLTDFQLQVEHALDLVGREQVVFVDATAAGEARCTLAPVAPARDASATTHALSPAAVLDAYVRVTGLPLPATHVLAIRGYAFELGDGLSAGAAANLEAAGRLLVGALVAPAPVPA